MTMTMTITVAMPVRMMIIAVSVAELETDERQPDLETGGRVEHRRRHEDRRATHDHAGVDRRSVDDAGGRRNIDGGAGRHRCEGDDGSGGTDRWSEADAASDLD
jgi:hypothetical protein